MVVHRGTVQRRTAPMSQEFTGSVLLYWISAMLLCEGGGELIGFHGGGERLLMCGTPQWDDTGRYAHCSYVNACPAVFPSQRITGPPLWGFTLIPSVTSELTTQFCGAWGSNYKTSTINVERTTIFNGFACVPHHVTEITWWTKPGCRQIR